MAQKILMKVLYAARLGRYDILRATCMLARRVSKWNEDCDRRLHRLMSYLHCTNELVTTGYVGDDIDHCKIGLFCDADFAGDKTDSRSTSGIFLVIVGPRTYFPITAVSKKQECVSLSTCESEMVSLALGIKSEGLPAMDIWFMLRKAYCKEQVLDDEHSPICLSSKTISP